MHVSLDSAIGRQPLLSNVGELKLNPSGQGYLVSTQSSGTVTIKVKTSTGYATAQWWDGTSTTAGNGTASALITFNKTIASPYTGSVEKPFYFYSSTSGSDETQSGNLTYLDANDSGQKFNQVSLVGLSSLTHILLTGSFKYLDLIGLSALTTLDITNANINELDLLDVSSTLTSLTLLNCDSLTNIANLSKAINLENLRIENSANFGNLDLSSLDEMGQLKVLSNPSIQEITIYGNTNFSIDWYNVVVRNNSSLSAFNVAPGTGVFTNATYLYYYGVLDFRNNNLSVSALDDLYDELKDFSSNPPFSPLIITVTGNPGAGAGSGSDPSIATDKGWTVVGDSA